MPAGGGIRTRLIGPALGLLAVVLVLAFAWGSSLYRQIELKTLDMRFGMRPALPQSPKILHVDIDDSSISSFGRWPWPRERHAQLLDLLKEMGADSVLFDVEFPEPSAPADDNALAAALRRTGFSFLPFRLDLEGDLASDQIEERIKQVLRTEFEADATRISTRLKIPVSAVDEKLVSLKKSIARETGWEILRREGRLSEKALVAKLMPESDPSIRSVEETIIPSAVDYCLAMERILRVASKPRPEGADGFSVARQVSPPIAQLAEDASGFGASNATPDPEDGVIRHVSLFYFKDGRLLPHLSLTGACRALGATMDNVTVVPGRHVVIHPASDVAGGNDPVVIPIDDRGRVLINWAGSAHAPWQELFAHVPYGAFLELRTIRENLESNDDVFRNGDPLVDGRWSTLQDSIARVRATGATQFEDARRIIRTLLAAQERVEKEILAKLNSETAKYTEEELKKQSIATREMIDLMKHDMAIIPSVWKAREQLRPREKTLSDRLATLVKGKLCIVGSTQSASTDLKPTPLSSLFPGVGVHSAVINSVLQRSFIREAPAWLNVLIIAAVGLAVCLLSEFLSTRWAALANAGVLVGWGAAALALFAFANLWVVMAGPLIAGVLAYAAVTAWRQLTEERQKRHIRNVFQHYLSPVVVEQVLKDPASLKLGGERKELTVFFSDVAGFTPIAEKMEPEELVMLLNEYLSEMSEVVLESRGYINKYEGDAIMAVFGAPLHDPDHAAAACRVALESQRRLRDFREKLQAEGRPIIRARVGINSGVMVVGNMGSRKLFDYTVMGDNVNIGARLEGANKSFGTEIIIGEDTYTRVKDLFETRRLGMVSVKGRTKPVGAWELIAEKGRCPAAVAKLLPVYNEGLAAYAEQNWDAACSAFAECLRISPVDGPSRAYMNRCLDLSRSEKPPQWDGTFPLDGK